MCSLLRVRMYVCFGQIGRQGHSAHHPSSGTVSLTTYNIRIYGLRSISKQSSAAVEQRWRYTLSAKQFLPLKFPSVTLTISKLLPARLVQGSFDCPLRACALLLQKIIDFLGADIKKSSISLDRAFNCGAALLHKSADGRGSPFPGQTYPTASVTGIPSAV